MKDASSKRNLDDYTVDRHKKRSRVVEVLRSVNTYFTSVMNFENYHVTLQSQKYNGHIYGQIAKWAKRMDVQMKSSIFKPSDPSSIHDFRNNFETACDSNGVHGGATMPLFPHFKEVLGMIVLSYWMSTTEDNTAYKEGTMTAHRYAVNYVRETYATDDVADEPEVYIINYKQPENMSTTRYSEILWERASTSSRVYEKSRLNSMYIEGLHHSFRFSIRSYEGARIDATLLNMARYANSSFRLQQGFNTSSITTHAENRSWQRPSKIPIRNDTRPLWCELLISIVLS